MIDNVAMTHGRLADDFHSMYSASATSLRLLRRLGDTLMAVEDDDKIDWEAVAAPWFQCAQELEASLGTSRYLVQWLLITDSANLKAWAEGKSMFRHKLMSGHHDRVHHSTERGKMLSAALDNWLLGLTDFQVITEMSQFGRSAALRAHPNSSIFTMHQDLDDVIQAYEQHIPAKVSERSCSVEDPDNLTEVLMHGFTYESVVLLSN